jgi:Ca-activated chloride channel homolog
MKARNHRIVPKFLVVLLLCTPAFAESSASKNKTGNQLFEQGKYQDAEKAYLDAQAQMPGRPELSYNLGNSLIKQKKYDQALRSLRQAVSKGDPGLQASSWYNLGNALFDMGNLKDSAQAYIQSLHLNPTDKDAKHNLELALKKLQEQKQQQSGQGKNQDSNGQNSQGNQNPEQGKNQPKTQDKDPSQSQNSKGQQPENRQSNQASRPEGSISKERALQILDALRNQELADQRKLLVRPGDKRIGVRDW